MSTVEPVSVSAPGELLPLHAASARIPSTRAAKRTSASLAHCPVEKRLHLLRHAKSSWGDSSLADRDRPLAPRGRKAAKRIGRYLRENEIRPELVLCSSSVRTQQTLERLALPRETPVELDERLYAASAEDILERLCDVPASVNSVLVIAHNPGLEELALELASSGPDRERLAEKFPTGALASLRFDGGWDELTPGACTLVGYVVPRELG
jgi:phosphohistidine phosphatase